MISIELNTAVKAHLTSLGSPYDQVEILPLAGYEATSAPFIIYNEYPGTQNEEQFFLRISNVVYTIMDDDISRAKDVAYQLEQYLNVGDYVAGIKSDITNPYDSGPLRYRLTTCRLVSGSGTAASQREGFTSISRNFRVVYLDDGRIL
jgi:hypothetical protein